RRPPDAGRMTAQPRMLQPDLVGDLRGLEMQRARLEQLEAVLPKRPFDFDRHADDIFGPSQEPTDVRNLCRLETRLRDERGRHRLGGRRATMLAGDRVILLTDGRTKELTVATKFEAIGRDLALRDRRPQSPGRADEHLAGCRLAQSAAGRPRR